MSGGAPAHAAPLEKQNTGFTAAAEKLLWLLFAAFVALVVCFFSGWLPWQPTAIATGSMEPEISIGDMVVASSLGKDDVAVGDVICFQHGGSSVVHRVVAIEEQDGQIAYITKGDANNANDSGSVAQEDVVGKVVLTVPKVGYLTLWLHAAA